jgi:hypothetical protein
MHQSSTIENESCAIAPEVITPAHEQGVAPGLRLMASGALWCAGGLAVTMVTYHAAPEGGVFLVCWGPVLFGALDVLKGLAAAVSSSGS